MGEEDPHQDGTQENTHTEEEQQQQQPSAGGTTPRSCIRGQSSGPPAKSAARLFFSPEVVVAPDVLFEPPYEPESEGTVTRLFDEVKKRDEKLQAKRELLEKETLEELAGQFRPSLSKLALDKGKRYNNHDEFIEAQLKWKPDRHQALTKKMIMNDTILQSQRPANESMSKVTKNIVSRMEKEKRYRSPVAGWKRHFENFLLKQAGMAGPTETTRRSSSPTYAAQHSFAPTISAYAYEKADHDQSISDHNHSSSHLNQSGRETVFDRLHNEHHVRKLAQKVLTESYIESVMGGAFSPETNEPPASLRSHHHFYDPTQSGGGGYDGSGGGDGEGDEDYYSFDHGPRHPAVVVDTLLAKGQQYEEKKAHLRALKEQSKETFTFKPETNPNSKRILKAFANKTLSELEEERMARGGKMYADNSSNMSSASASALPQGVKGIQPPKKAAKFDLERFTARMDRHKAIKEANIKAISTDYEYAEAKECSFRPALTKTAVAPHTRATYQRPDGLLSGTDHLSIYSTSSPRGAVGGRGPRGASQDYYEGGGAASGREAVEYTPARSSRSTPAPTVVAPVSRRQQQQQYHPARASIPKAAASPHLSRRHPQSSPPQGQTYSGISSTASERHRHNASGAEEEMDPTNYLANLEAEMEQVLTEWRQAADEV